MTGVDGVGGADARPDRPRDMARLLKLNDRAVHCSLAQAGVRRDARDAGIARPRGAIRAEREHKKHMLLRRRRVWDRHRRVLEVERGHAPNLGERIGRRWRAPRSVVSKSCPPARSAISAPDPVAAGSGALLFRGGGGSGPSPRPCKPLISNGWNGTGKAGQPVDFRPLCCSTAEARVRFP